VARVPADAKRANTSLEQTVSSSTPFVSCKLRFKRTDRVWNGKSEVKPAAAPATSATTKASGNQPASIVAGGARTPQRHNQERLGLLGVGEAQGLASNNGNNNASKAQAQQAVLPAEQEPPPNTRSAAASSSASTSIQTETPALRLSPTERPRQQRELLTNGGGNPSSIGSRLQKPADSMASGFNL
jgi:hypothetical protein